MADKAVYWQRGESIDYANSGDAKIEAGTVVELGSLIGVTGCDIAPGEVGSLHIVGVFKFAKGSGAINAGAGVVVSASTGKAAAAGANDTANGVAIEAAASDATEVLVKINV